LREKRTVEVVFNIKMEIAMKGSGVMVKYMGLEDILTRRRKGCMRDAGKMANIVGKHLLTNQILLNSTDFN